MLTVLAEVSSARVSRRRRRTRRGVEAEQQRGAVREGAQRRHSHLRRDCTRHRLELRQNRAPISYLRLTASSLCSFRDIGPKNICSKLMGVCREALVHPETNPEDEIIRKSSKNKIISTEKNLLFRLTL
ncbi:Phenylalanine--tRNA ligase beta subunit [Frankliniella fusca]|uniref:Phenylalanine--tRNA ligase beta subunit n=1 Tax=Frankliniella fusca TaxID=407009 RepID=A0AAE1LKU2_9NEOP|nr:Phenylalanine--tRNA ligase beta subunit [Frankliniella fusca]